MSDVRPDITLLSSVKTKKETIVEVPSDRFEARESRQSISQFEPERRKKHLRPVWIVLIVLLPCLALTFYYSQIVFPGVEPRESFLPSTSYALVLLLLNLDLMGFVVLLLLLSRNLIKAYFERQHRLFGAGFQAKLVAAFIGFSLIPTLLFALVASGLMNKAVDVWFSDQIEQVLRDSFDVARMQHASHMNLAVNSARAISHDLYLEDMLLTEHRDLLVAAITRKRTELGVAGIEVLSSKMEPLAKALDRAVPVSVFNLPIHQLVLQVLNSTQEATVVQESEMGRLVRAAAPIVGSRGNRAIVGVVVVAAFVPESLLTKMEGIEHQYDEYTQTKAMKNPVKVGVYIFVAVITVLILFGATWFGFYVARSITVPIQRLAEATEAIAQGDLSVRIEAKATDEIGVLVRSFNRMTTDLEGNKSRIEKANFALRQSNFELDRRRAYIESVVETIAAGVISIDKDGRITNFNPSGEEILKLQASRLLGRFATEVFKDFKLNLFQTVYDRMIIGQNKTLTLDGTIEVEGRFLTISLHGSEMMDDANRPLGLVFVFEDLTELLKAQKVAAWQEVARRVAHEIKNPLTPIQLSAQRLRKKYLEKSPDFDAIFDDSTNVIINEVTNLKHMVDEFSKFARLPIPQMAYQSFHDGLSEVVALYRMTHNNLNLIVSLDESLPSFNFDREQLKRVMVNLLDNAMQATQQTGRVWISTMYETKRRRAVVRVADEGEGITPDDRALLFEPYFTRKKTGTGLGLAIVQRIITDHNGEIYASQNQPKGAVFTFELPV